MAEVILKNVSKRFGEATVVKEVNLEIADQEFVVLVGPSGCGKSTTLRMIAGLEEVSSGEIYIGDDLVNDVPPKDRDIAMVFQNYALYPHMNVYENLSFALKLRKLPKAQIDARVRETARMLGIEDLLNRKPKQLSGGQRQRVAVGRAIVRHPRVFLFDEPLSNLDAKLRVAMRSELSKLHHRLQTTIVYVTHDQTEAMTMGDRVVVMKDGLIQQVGAPLEVYDNPANVFVAGFIGSPAMNLIPARLVDQDGELYLDAQSFKVRVPGDRAPLSTLAGYRDKEVIFGIRPEDILDAELASSPDPHATFETMVEVLEPMGNESFLHCRAGDHAFVARVGTHTKAKDGITHPITLRMAKMHLFDKETGTAIA